VIWALTAGGPDGSGGAAGVTELLATLTDDLAHVMTLAGARDVGELTADLVC
jgi:isopentenyl diphosphate isomerase/L-lactate dehydrogenase-like FMN-dependent dehydrogenase